VSKDYSHEVGYESLLADFSRYKQQTPKGITLVKEGQNIYLQFKTPNKSRSKYKCACSFTLDGMVEALGKAHKVAEALKALTSETEFWDWYDSTIKESVKLTDDRLTFGEAIAKVEDDFWSRLSRKKEKRDKNNPSDLSSWDKTYGTFYRHLPIAKEFNLVDIQNALSNYPTGTKNRKGAISAFKKLSEFNGQKRVFDSLGTLDISQTVFVELQTVSIEEFVHWREQALGITQSLHKNSDIDTRKAWLWVFSTQIVYALRISEVFAIKNLTEPYVSKDGISIPALSDPENITNLIYIGAKTNLGTTVKTGSRIARPLIPPKYPDLIEDLEIKTPLMPTNRPKGNNPRSIRNFHCATARRKLVSWGAPFTQTHADRHLGNINGMQAGVPLEIRAQSMGHTPAMNDSIYKKRQSTQTTIDLLLNSNQNAIDFVTALAEAKKLVAEDENNREVIIRLLSIIYQKDSRALAELL
jgi:hypothetical protein